MTAVSAEARERVRRLDEWLEDQCCGDSDSDGPVLDMSVWFASFEGPEPYGIVDDINQYEPDAVWHCGTSCCIAGFVVLDACMRSDPGLRGNGGEHVATVAEWLLEVPAGIADWLFAMCSWSDSGEPRVGNRRDTIRHAARFGVWKVLDTDGEDIVV